MARGRGRGRGRGRKMSLMNDGSSIEACVEALVTQELVPAQSEEISSAAENARNTTVVRKLCLDPLEDEEEGFKNSDLKGFEGESNTRGNGTVIRALSEKISEEEGNIKEIEQEKKITEPWLEEIEVQEEEQKWKCALIAYVVGECPGYNSMKRYIIMNWSNWCPEFDLGNEFLTEIPLWVNFPKLPLNCWGVGSLSRIASAIGVPLFADECTTKQTRISYARMLIEVNVTKAIPQQITVVDPNGKTFLQDVELE
uniref:Uncharacterized protein n=1 Tax=Solanum lycopersicum TaxID=4081 RepID=A0A494G8C7_SOLLC